MNKDPAQTKAGAGATKIAASPQVTIISTIPEDTLVDRISAILSVGASVLLSVSGGEERIKEVLGKMRGRLPVASAMLTVRGEPGKGGK